MRSRLLVGLLLLVFGLPFGLLGLLALAPGWHFPQALPPAYSLLAAPSVRQAHAGRGQ
jgi:putative spermidine/putrescine transport system permease protein